MDLEDILDAINPLIISSYDENTNLDDYVEIGGFHYHKLLPVTLIKRAEERYIEDLYPEQKYLKEAQEELFQDFWYREFNYTPQSIDELRDFFCSESNLEYTSVNAGHAYFTMHAISQKNVISLDFVRGVYSAEELENLSEIIIHTPFGKLSITDIWFEEHWTRPSPQISNMDLRSRNYQDLELNFFFLNDSQKHVDNLDLSGVNLSDESIIEVDLTGVNLSGANLSLTHFWDVVLKDADLTEANLRNATFSCVDLREANLTRAHLHDASFDEKTQWPQGFDPIKAGAQKESS